ERQLPARVDLATFDFNTLKRSSGELKELVPGLGLYQGDVPSTVDDAHAKKNIGAAEIFDRLADNALKKKRDDFSVAYLGKSYTSVPSLLKALQDDGCKVSARIDYRAADFADLKMKDPSQPSGVVDIPAAILVRTGVKDAVLPAIHGELIFHVEKGPNTKGPGLDADFKWYQGVPTTGFVPCDVSRRSSWLGRNTTCNFADADAIKAASLAANFGDVVNSAASKNGLWDNGYGVTGVCLDSVGIIEQAMTGTASGFPLFMHDSVLAPEVTARLQDGRRGDDADLRVIQTAMAAVPSDDQAGQAPLDQEQRVKASMPWTKANAPVQCVADAIDALGM
ncbi:MAG TPA: hypothetical protein VGO62_14105, partial [Myxococcota bacterium]